MIVVEGGHDVLPKRIRSGKDSRHRGTEGEEVEGGTKRETRPRRERQSSGRGQVNITEHVAHSLYATTLPQYSTTIKLPQASHISFSPHYPSLGIASPAMILVPSCHLYQYTFH